MERKIFEKFFGIAINYTPSFFLNSFYSYSESESDHEIESLIRKKNTINSPHDVQVLNRERHLSRRHEHILIIIWDIRTR